jgi:hypothetical protein
MKTEETITTFFGGGAGASSLGSHAFLNEFALAYQRPVAERLRAEPEAVLEPARRNLNRWAEGDAFGAGERASLEEWQRILAEADVDRLFEIMTDTSDEGHACARPRLSLAFFHPKSDWRYSPPVNREQLFDLTERVKLVAGVDILIVGSQSLYGVTSQVPDIEHLIHYVTF